MNIDRETLSTILHRNIARVTFTKSDGEVRVGRFTLMQEHLPPPTPIDESAAPKRTPPYNKDVLPVWDMDKKAWRSFRIDSLREIVLGGEDTPEAAPSKEIPW